MESGNGKLGYLHYASGTFTSIHLTLCRVSPGELVLILVVVTTFQLVWRMVDHICLTRANWEQFQHLCSTRLHQSTIADADDPISLFTSNLKDIAEETIPKTSAFSKMQSKSATGPLKGSHVNQPRVT